MSINLTYSSDLSESFIKVRHHHSKSIYENFVQLYRSHIFSDSLVFVIAFSIFFLPNRFDVFMRRKRHQNFIWMIGFDRCNLNFRANLSPIHHHHCEPNSTTLLSPSSVRNGHTSVSTKLGVLRNFFCEILKINISFKVFSVVSHLSITYFVDWNEI